MNREDNSYQAQHMFRKYLQKYYFFFKDVIVEKKSHVLISMIVLKLKCKAQENKWQLIMKNTAMIYLLHIFAEKVTEELDVINLSFSNFL